LTNDDIEVVGTAPDPFIARDIPTADESMVVIRFANPKGIDFPYLISMLHNSWMSRPNNIVVPGGQMGLAMLAFTAGVRLLPAADAGLITVLEAVLADRPQQRLRLSTEASASKKRDTSREEAG